MTARDHARALLESVADSHDDLTRAVAGVGWALLTDPYPRREADNTAATGHQRRHVPAVAPPTPDPEPVEGSGSAGAYANGYRPAPAQHPTDRHLLPKEDR